MVEKTKGEIDQFVTPADVVKQTEEYVSSNQLPALFKGMAVDTFKARPEKPIAFLIDYLMRLDPLAAEEVMNNRLKIAEANHANLPEGLRVTVSHTEAGAHDYLVNKVRSADVSANRRALKKGL
jgi:hypothetical protein